jgi:hypothetical protein
MPYDLLADAAVVLHFSFVALVVIGGFVALRWGWVWWPHLAAVAYGAGIVLIGWSCPLTDLERALREAGGDEASARGFVERYLEGVIYPGDRTPTMRVLAALAIAVSWALLLHRRRRRSLVRDPGRRALRSEG